MLQIIAFGVAFLLFGLGVIARQLKVLATPLLKDRDGVQRKPGPSTGLWEQVFCTVLGLIILAWAYSQGVAVVAKAPELFGF